MALKQGDMVRETKDVKAEGELVRSRTWIGEWTIVIARGADVLKTITVKATK